MEKQVPKVLANLKSMNKGYKIKLRYRRYKDKYGLFLDYWNKGKREKEYLQIYIIGNRHCIHRDKEQIEIAKAIRDEREKALYETKAGLKTERTVKKINFIEFFRKFADSKPDRNYRISFDHFKSFYSKDKLDIKDVSFALSEQYREYLLALEITRYTAQHYFAAYKACLNYAVKLHHVNTNPAKGLGIKYERKTIERLTIDELEKLKATECQYPDLKNGFLFACFTGLRISDLRKLKFSDISKEHLKFMQQKTKTENKIKLTAFSNDIIKEQLEHRLDDHIFHIPSGGKTSKRLKQWLKNAGIKKRITFHCSRHTFGCLLIENGVDVFSVKKLMGHRDIKTTMQYVEKVDTTLDKAIDRLPGIK